MNLIFGWLALSSGYMAGMLATPESSVYGEVRDVRAVIGSVLHGSPAEKTGLMPGDAIVALQSGTMELAGPITATSVTEFIGVHQDESLVLEVQRNGEQKIIITKAEEGFIEGKKALGVSMADVGILQLPVHLALLQGAIAAKDVTIGTAQGLVSFFSMLALGQANWDSVAGPVGIATVGSSAVQEGFAAAAFLAALISVNLALINVLPIPGLDGGRLLIIIIEGVLRRPISPKVVTGLSLAGFALIITLMVVVTYHDIIKLLA
jgi:regulator of sigma E protease